MPLPEGVNIPLTYSHLLLIGKVILVTRSFNYGLFAGMIWDMLLTFADEVKYIWKAPWTVIKVVFLFNRYVTPIVVIGSLYTLSGLATDLTDEGCRRWVLVSVSIEQVSLALVAFIIILRLHAVWQASRRTLYLLMGVWIAGTSASIAMLIEVFYKNKRLIYYEDRANVCFTLVPNVWKLWLPDIVMHAFLVFFLVFKAIATPRSSQTRMLAVLYSDGIIYYSVTLTAITLSFISWKTAHYLWIGLPLYSCWMILTIAMSRLLLSLKTTQVVHFHNSRRRRLTLHGHDDSNFSGGGHGRNESDEMEMDESPSLASPTDGKNTKKVSFMTSTVTSGPNSPNALESQSSFMDMQPQPTWGRLVGKPLQATHFPSIHASHLGVPHHTPVGGGGSIAGGSIRGGRSATTGGTGDVSSISSRTGNWWWWLFPHRSRSRTSFTDHDEDEVIHDPYDYMRGHEKYVSWL
ncbi:hypothetical protein PIIN_10498 [Serendipita indica DSM 11827]|uniref:DUF6533 domain-containing protein n=1 Tax=Serendipita indica (strain DSM 11827) TaxID=1109443 RepID=G4TYW2_SERID|nr:hypothetical protein PIIN_10498 [Serendipita indica DSM 11827]